MDTERSDSSESGEYAFPGYVSAEDEGEEELVGDFEEDDEAFDDDFEDEDLTEEESGETDGAHR